MSLKITKPLPKLNWLGFTNLMLRKVIKGLADQPTNTLSSPDKAGQDQLSSRS
ncbi:hypothetical protein JL09_g5174 [Pichia kudriavzevii]|uniref:Uncharacterized protein n=1 Tax=Pichia kudriavzevii TaxID=4909 RepID=A0A099NUU6_PICKU|nr:hypothetical protein JL09_g5174 [Pichia kudriavzevii]